MPLMELTLTQEFASQVTINRFNYVASGTPAAVSFSFALVSAIGAIPNTGIYPSGTLIDAIRLIQVDDVTFQGVEARDVYSDTDFYATGFVPALTGASAGEPLSPFVAIGFVSSRVRQSVRRATKRFVGANEGMSLGGKGVIDAAFLAGSIGTCASRLGAVLTYNDEGNTLTFTPAVVKKQKYAVPDSDPVRYAYRYIPVAEGGETAQLAQTAEGVSWTPYSTFRSQVSRQYGRGR